MNFFEPLHAITDWTRTRRGVELRAGQETIRLDFIWADVVRMKISQGGVFDTMPTFAVVQDSFDPPSFSVRKTAKGLSLTSEAVSVRVGFDPFHLAVFRADGSSVLQSLNGQAYQFLNNHWCVRRRKTPQDTILGLGEKTQPFNHNGKKLTMWNHDVLGPDTDGTVRVDEGEDLSTNPLSDRFDPYYMSINFHYHLPHRHPEHASASFIDNGYKLHYDFSEKNHYEIQGEGGQLTEYMFAGPRIPDILARFTTLTGRMSPPPLWALGHHQCRWHDYSQQAVKTLAGTYRKKQIPCDSLWLDIDYMDGYRVFTWDNAQFPRPQRLLEALRKDGFRVITIIDPGVKVEPGYAVYDEGRERNLFCKTESGQTYVGQVWPGRTAFPDFVKEEARTWWGRLNAEHVQSGLAGIWNDMNEPATGAVSPLAMRFDRDGENHPHERYRNQYALLMAMGTVMGLREAMPNLRTFVLSRAGFAGIQRYAANWTGDNTATWEHLAMSLPMNANLGLSGQPFVGSDIGGFTGESSPELLIRWYQYGVFQPFMRNHLCKGSPAHYPWTFGPETEKKIKASIELRYQLLPYVYTSFMQCAETGMPIQRPLVYEWQDDPAAVVNDREFMFGDHLLTAPVIQQGQTERVVYLPKGEWLCFYTGARYAGETRHSVAAPLHHLPIFVRAGAVIPRVKTIQTTHEFFPDVIDLHVYIPRQNGKTVSLLHEDDGLTDAHQRGGYLRTMFTLTRKGKTLTLSADTEGKGFPEYRRKRFRIIFYGEPHRPVSISNSGKPFRKTFNL